VVSGHISGTMRIPLIRVVGECWLEVAGSTVSSGARIVFRAK